MPFLNWVEPETATGQAADYYKMVGVAPILKCYSLRPDFGMAIAQASMVFHFSHGALPRRDHEAVAAYVSAINYCPY